MSKVKIFEFCLILICLFFSSNSFSQEKKIKKNLATGSKTSQQINDNEKQKTESNGNPPSNKKAEFDVKQLANKKILKGKVYLGYKKINYSILGYKNAVLNDNHKYPSRTGQTYVEFEEGNKDISTSFQLGVAYIYNKTHEFGMDVVFGSSDGTTTAAYILGYNYNLNLIWGISLFAGTGVGYTTLNTKIGEIEDSGSLPIILGDDSFTAGDKIESEISGALLEFRLGLSVDITNRLFFFLSAVNLKSSFNSVKTYIAGKEIKDNQAFDSGSQTGNTITVDYNSNINPLDEVEVKSSSTVYSGGLGFRF